MLKDASLQEAKRLNRPIVYLPASGEDKHKIAHNIMIDKGEVVSDYKKRPEGMRAKHTVNRNSIKMYDKKGCILRLETTFKEMK